MQVNSKPITIEEALNTLRDWAMTNRIVMLSVHFGVDQLITYHKGELRIEEETHVCLISAYDQHVSVEAKAYEDFVEGDTDGKRWVMMKTGGPSTSRPPVVMFRLFEEGDDIHSLPPTVWGAN